MVTAALGREAAYCSSMRLLDLVDAAARRSCSNTSGIGKTTVWRHGITRAVGERYRVLSCRTTQTEARLSLAIGHLLAPLEPGGLRFAAGSPMSRARRGARCGGARAAAVNPRAIGRSFRCYRSSRPPRQRARDRRPPMARPAVGARASNSRCAGSMRNRSRARHRTARRASGAPRSPGIDDVNTVARPRSGALYRIIETHGSRAAASATRSRSSTRSG